MFLGASQGRTYHGGIGAPTSSNIPTNLQASDSNIKIWTGSTWDTLQTSVNNNSFNADGFTDEWGPESQFAYRYRQDHPDRVIYILKYNHVATSLASNWLSGGPDFINISSQFTSAMAAAPAGAFVDMVHWSNGGSDSTNSTNAGNYQTNLVTFLALVRSTFAAGRTIPFTQEYLYGALSTGTFPFRDTVRTKQLAFFNDVGNVNQWLIETDSYAIQSDNIHYNVSSIPTFGDDIYSCYKGTYVFT